MKVLLLKIIIMLLTVPLIYFYGIKITAFIFAVGWLTLSILLILNNKIYDKYINFTGAMPRFFSYFLDRKNSILVCFMYSIFLTYVGFAAKKDILKISTYDIPIMLVVLLVCFISDYFIKKYVRSIFVGILAIILLAIFLTAIILAYYLKFVSL